MQALATALMLFIPVPVLAQAPPLTAEEQKLAAAAQRLNNAAAEAYRAGRAVEALKLFQQALEINRRLYTAEHYPDGHADLANSLGNLAVAIEAMGRLAEALPYYVQALAMRQKLYPESKFPNGHATLASSYNNVGHSLQSLGQPAKALPYYERALAMRRKLFPVERHPDGHPALATSLNNMGFVRVAMGQAEQALPWYEQSFAMLERLFPPTTHPDGHPDLSRGLNSLGHAREALGQFETARGYYELAVAMDKRLYPPTRHADGHPLLAISINNLGSALLAMASARVAGTAVADQINELKGNRRRTDQLLQDSRMDKVDRDKLLVKYADERDTLERKLLAAMPLLKRGQELDQLGPDALVQSLPPHAVFVDLIAYTRFEYEKGKQKRIPSYVAFVLGRSLVGGPPLSPGPTPQGGEGGKSAPGSPAIVRIELGDAKDINDAIHAWRSAITVGKPSAEAGRLARLVWDPIVKQLPPGTKTLYLAPDGNLSRLPWAALPVSKGRVLLEDYAIAQVPHGTFLLDQLKFPRWFTGPDALLAMGGIDYGPGIWPALPGTATEVEALTKLAPRGATRLTKADATIAKVRALLPTARYAHLATHGEFQADALTAERKRAAAAVAARQLGDESRHVAAKNPLGYVGLVLANSDIFSGLSIVDLQLGNLQLVTLSACETGLGELTGGEGVQGLQRAFHLAGCPNVVASLWKVNDAATAALMTKFYHEMWVNKKPTIEALREAQLTIYRHPELIPDLAGERGAPRLKEAIIVRAGAPVTGTGKHADTKLWAAFVLSGLGK